MDDFSSLAGRREFLKGAAWMGATAMAAGCMSRATGVGGIGGGAGAPMHGFRVPPMKQVRVGVIGVGGRTSFADTGMQRDCNIRHQSGAA